MPFSVDCTADDNGSIWEPRYYKSRCSVSCWYQAYLRDIWAADCSYGCTCSTYVSIYVLLYIALVKNRWTKHDRPWGITCKKAMLWWAKCISCHHAISSRPMLAFELVQCPPVSTHGCNWHGIENLCTMSRYQRQGQIITSHSIFNQMSCFGYILVPIL